jgi:hypothetical protein
MRQTKNPEPHDLTYTPELAILATLDAVLEIAASALMSAHPQLSARTIPLHTDPQASLVWIGAAIISEARMLQNSLQMYRDAIDIVYEAVADEMEQEN